MAGDKIVHKLDAKSQPIRAVTVYKSRARVERIVSLELQAGLNEIVITKLSGAMEHDSLRVETTSAGISVHDVSIAHPSTDDDEEEKRSKKSYRHGLGTLDELTDEQKEEYSTLARRKDILTTRLASYERSAALVNTYANNLVTPPSRSAFGADKSDVPVLPFEKLDEFLKQYPQRIEEFMEKWQDAREELDIVEGGLHDLNEIAKKNKLKENPRARIPPGQMANRWLSNGRAPRPTVTIAVLAENIGVADLTLTYLVAGPSWTGNYDIHANLPSSSSSSASSTSLNEKPASPNKLTVLYNASITQLTDEDWDGVALTLSTATPGSSSITIPKLTAWKIAPAPEAPRPNPFFTSTPNLTSHPPRTGLFGQPQQATGGLFGQAQAQQQAQQAAAGLFGQPQPQQQPVWQQMQQQHVQATTSAFGSFGVAASTTPAGSPAFGQRAYSPPALGATSAFGTTREFDRERERDIGGEQEQERAESPPLSPVALPPKGRGAVAGGVDMISAAIQVDGRSTIPSDGSSHKVLVTALVLDAEMDWISVPRHNPAAFLQCRVTNKSDFVLVGGPSQIFFDGNFVARSSLPDVSPGESFSCSLGIDPAVKITYHPEQRTTRESKPTTSTGSDSLWSRIANANASANAEARDKPKTDATLYSRRISVRNTRSWPIKRLVVRDQVHVSQDEKVKVTLVNPPGDSLGPMNPEAARAVSVTEAGAPSKATTTSPSTETVVATVKPGVQARWAQKSDRDGGSGGSKGDGVVEWICEDVSGELDIELAWTVVSPHGVALVNVW